jgi:serine/threonine-protein kinase
MRQGTRSLPLASFVSAKPAIQPHEGLRLGRYELLVPIAQGGMAEVWIARLLGDLGFARIVAIKTIRPEYSEDPSFRKGFFEEARIAARMSHANVVEVLDLGEEGSILYQVMRLVEGDSVSKLLRHRHEKDGSQAELRGLPVASAAHIMIDALKGLHAAHELTDDDGIAMQLVHRDVSPHNILVGVDGVARLSDFGVAKALGRLVDVTDAGQIRGKPGYFAPEQVDHKPLDRRTDIFAAGIVMWEMMTGKHLFRSDEGRPPLGNVQEPPYPDPRKHCKEELPEAIVLATMRALHHDPHDRFATAEDMANAMQSAARSSSATASSSEVGQLVIDLCGHRVVGYRSQVKKAMNRRPRPPSTTGVERPTEPHAKALAVALTQSVEPGSVTPSPQVEAKPTMVVTTAITDYPVPKSERRREHGRASTYVQLGLYACGILLVLNIVHGLVSTSRLKAHPSEPVVEAAVDKRIDPALYPLSTDEASARATTSTVSARKSESKSHPASRQRRVNKKTRSH